MKPKYHKHFLYGNMAYTYIYLANSTNKLIQIMKRLERWNSEATVWIGKEQPFRAVAPPMIGGSND